jgi:putative transcription antitermination factor YqgF
MSILASNEAKVSHYLGIDSGRSEVGLSLADTETRMAFGHGKMKNDKDLIQKIAAVIAEESVSVVVIGIPTHMNQKSGEYDGEKLGQLIQEAVPGIQIEYQNEMFTTKMAQSNLMQGGKKNIKDLDDEESARIILQEWLDKNVVFNNLPPLG